MCPNFQEAAAAGMPKTKSTTPRLFLKCVLKNRVTRVSNLDLRPCFDLSALDLKADVVHSTDNIGTIDLDRVRVIRHSQLEHRLIDVSEGTRIRSGVDRNSQRTVGV